MTYPVPHQPSATTSVDTPPVKPDVIASWEHFAHAADIGVRGTGRTLAQAFEQAALALTAVITNLKSVAPITSVELACAAPDDELLFVDWLNAVIFEMATRKWLFSRYHVAIEDGRLHATAWGEPTDIAKHHPAVEIKGATYTALRVTNENGTWIAQCVVDV